MYYFFQMATKLLAQKYLLSGYNNSINELLHITIYFDLKSHQNYY